MSGAAAKIVKNDVCPALSSHAGDNENNHRIAPLNVIESGTDLLYLNKLLLAAEQMEPHVFKDVRPVTTTNCKSTVNSPRSYEEENKENSQGEKKFMSASMSSAKFLNQAPPPQLGIHQKRPFCNPNRQFNTSAIPTTNSSIGSSSVQRFTGNLKPKESSSASTSFTAVRAQKNIYQNPGGSSNSPPGKKIIYRFYEANMKSYKRTLEDSTQISHLAPCKGDEKLQKSISVNSSSSNTIVTNGVHSNHLLAKTPPTFNNSMLNNSSSKNIPTENGNLNYHRNVSEENLQLNSPIIAHSHINNQKTTITAPFANSKRKRRRLCQEHVLLLESVFSQTSFPGFDLRESLGKRLGMSPRSIQIWFQNKRQNIKMRMKKNEGCTSTQNQALSPLSTEHIQLSNGNNENSICTSSGLEQEPQNHSSTSSAEAADGAFSSLMLMGLTTKKISDSKESGSETESSSSGLKWITTEPSVLKDKSLVEVMNSLKKEEPEILESCSSSSASTSSLSPEFSISLKSTEVASDHPSCLHHDHQSIMHSPELKTLSGLFEKVSKIGDANRTDSHLNIPQVVEKQYGDCEKFQIVKPNISNLLN